MVRVGRRRQGRPQRRPERGDEVAGDDPARAADVCPDALSLVLYTGKGGVGKTTTAAATALRAAERGRRTLVVSADPAHSLADVLGTGLEPWRVGTLPEADEPLPCVEVASKLFAVELDARFEVQRQWARIHAYLVRLFTHHGMDASLASELATLPGAYELATLLAVDRAVASGEFDLVVVDCAPTASTLRLTTLPDVARGMLRVLLGTLRGVAAATAPLARHWIAAPLPDAGVLGSAESLLYGDLTSLRTRLVAPSTAVRIVVTPEPMVVAEALRAYTDLCLFGLEVDAVVSNRVLDAGADDDPFWSSILAAQLESREALRTAFPSLPILEAPFRDEDVVGLSPLAELGAHLFRDRAPEARLAPRHAGARFTTRDDEVVLELPLPGVDADELDVALVDGDLVLTTPRRRRALPLPRRLGVRRLARARLADGVLEVGFAPRENDPACA